MKVTDTAAVPYRREQDVTSAEESFIELGRSSPPAKAIYELKIPRPTVIMNALGALRLRQPKNSTPVGLLGSHDAQDDAGDRTRQAHVEGHNADRSALELQARDCLLARQDARGWLSREEQVRLEASQARIAVLFPRARAEDFEALVGIGDESEGVNERQRAIEERIERRRQAADKP